jgi:VanZ family protein
MPDKVIGKRIWHALLIGYCLLIFILSSIPGEELPKVDFEYSDKFVHLIEYSVLYILFFYSLKNQSKYVKLRDYALEFSVLFTSLYGITDEIHQYFVLNRSCEFMDWVADTLGAIIMYFIFKKILIKRKLITVVILIFVLIGCSGSDEKKDMNKPVIKVELTEAWLDFMPVVGTDDKNRFGFVIDLNFKGKNIDTNYAVKDLEIKLNNDLLKEKKYNVRYKNFSDTAFNMELYQQFDEKYLDKNKDYPEEVTFTFSIFKNNNLIQKISTPKIKILKTQ